MQTRSRFSIHRKAVYFILASLAAITLANADDGTPAKQADAKKQEVSAKDSKEAASKLDLSTPFSTVNFHGSVVAGYETTFGKSACSGKSYRNSGMFSEITVGTDFKLSNDVTMSLLFSAGRYPGCFWTR